MSQEQLAEQLEVSRQSVSKWETGTSVPDLDKLIKMCDIFSVSLDELTGRAKNTDDAQSVPEASIASISSPPYSNASSYFNDAESTRRKRRAFGILFLVVSLVLIAASSAVSFFIGYRLGVFVFLPAVPALVGAVVCLTVKRNTAVFCIIAVIISAVISGILFFSFLIYGMFGMNTVSKDAHVDIRAKTYSFESTELSE